jgi:hypothetical protein
MSATTAAALPATISSDPTWELLQGVILGNHCEPVLVARCTPDAGRYASAR